MAASASCCNVRVVVRIRPLVARERLAGSRECLQFIPDAGQIIAGPDRAYTYDQVAGPEVSQQDIFDSTVVPVLQAFGEGYNGTILAYGQTGSGKTFTMGTGLDGNLDELTQGIIPRAVSFIFTQILYPLADPAQALPDTLKFGTTVGQWDLLVSFLEIYNEEIIDLLNPISSTGDKIKRPVLTIREDPAGDIYIAGIKEEAVRNEADIFSLLQKGTLCRTTKSTDMNLVSSRSHAIFTLILRQQRQNPDGQTISIVSKLHLVDLAGSERLKRTNAVGIRAKESISINSGLLALGNVISALGDESKKATHVPYRDSKLTRLLQDALGGNSRTLMIACVSPSSDNYAETLNTLKYAHRARNIRNKIVICQDASGNAVFEIMQLKKQISALKQEILVLRSSNTVPISTGRHGEENNNYGGGGAGNGYRIKLQELQRQLEKVQREKTIVETERDYYKKQFTASINAGISSEIDSKDETIHKLVKTVAELQARMAEFDHQSKKRLDQKNYDLNSEKLIVKPTNYSSLRNENYKAAKRDIIKVDKEAAQTPSWMLKTNDLIERTRAELQENLKIISEIRENTTSLEGLDCDSEKVEKDSCYNLAESTHASKFDRNSFAAAVAARTETILSQVETELGLKEELISQLQTSQQEYLAMKGKYDEKLQFLQENLLTVQRERDSLISLTKKGNTTMGTWDQHNDTNDLLLRKEARIKYEERIKKMGKELNELKEKVIELTKTGNVKHASNEQLIKNLRASVQTLKNERARLADRLEQETGRLKTDCIENNVELRELRQREYKANEAMKKWKRTCEMQRALLQRKTDQYQGTRGKMRLLLNALRKQRVALSSPSFRNSGINLDSPSWQRIQMECTSPIYGSSKSILGSRSQSTTLSVSHELHEHDNDEMALESEYSNKTNHPFIPTTNPCYIDVTMSSPRRPSLVQTAPPSPSTPGETLPRSVLRMSPLLPKRHDFFSRLTDTINLAGTVDAEGKRLLGTGYLGRDKGHNSHPATISKDSVQ